MSFKFVISGSILFSSGGVGLTSHTDDVLICAIVNLGSDLDKEIRNMKKSNLERELN